MSRIDHKLENGRILTFGLDHAPQGFFFQLEAAEGETEGVSDDGYVMHGEIALDGMNSFTSGLPKSRMIDNMASANLWGLVPDVYRNRIALDLDPAVDYVHV
jgi:hypothetical protein